MRKIRGYHSLFSSHPLEKAFNWRVMKKKILSIIGAAAAIAMAAPSVYAEEGKEKKPAKPAFGDVTVAELQAAIKEGKVTVVDVNRHKVYNEGHIPGALHFPTVKKKGLKKALPEDKAALVVAYCSGPQ